MVSDVPADRPGAEMAAVTTAAPATIMPTKTEPISRTPNLSSRMPQMIRPPQTQRNE